MTSRNGSAKYLQYTTRLDKLIQFLQRDTVFFMKLGTSTTDKILLLQKSLLFVLATDVYLVITFYGSSYNITVVTVVTNVQMTKQRKSKVVRKQTRSKCKGLPKDFSSLLKFTNMATGQNA